MSIGFVKPHKRYLIELEERHSVVALIAGVLVFFCTLGATLIWAEGYSNDGEKPLHYFTALSNLLSAVGAALMIPYAVEGIHKKHFFLPRYIILFQFAGATCVTITMLTSLLLILPLQGAVAVTGTNFWLHVVTPICTLVLLQCVETRHSVTRKEALLTLIPFWTYAVVYYTMVVLVGEENGGWSDIYMTTAFWPVWISLLLFLILGFAVSAGLRFLQNKRVKKTWKNITLMWTDDLEQHDLLIEAFGLGRYVGSKCDRDEITIPLDVFSLMTERYDIPLEKLVKAYTTGAVQALKERRDAQKSADLKK